MRRATNWIRWAMTAYFAVIATVGSGLHFLPGCGHAVDVGHGWMMCCGSHAHCGCRHEGTTGPGQNVTTTEGHDSPVHSEADCSICRLTATASQVVAPVLLELAQPLVQRSTTLVNSPRASSVPRAFAARAPPVAQA